MLRGDAEAFRSASAAESFEAPINLRGQSYADLPAPRRDLDGLAGALPGVEFKPRPQSDRRLRRCNRRAAHIREKCRRDEGGWGIRVAAAGCRRHQLGGAEEADLKRRPV